VGTQVTNERDSPEPIIRRKSLTAPNAGGMRTEIDMGEYGRIVTDEPVAYGGTGTGPSPLQTVLGATEDELRAVVEETERRCPVFNLMSDAGVELEMRWVRRAS
jgi:uncharacterized OsmC-like protein